MTELYVEDVTVAGGLDSHFPLDEYLAWLRDGNPYGLDGLATWVESRYSGIEFGYEGPSDAEVVSMVWVNVPSRINAGFETIRGPRWALDIYGGALRKLPYQHPVQRSVREARGVSSAMPCNEYRPHAELSSLDGTPFCRCGFERRQHDEGAMSE